MRKSLSGRDGRRECVPGTEAQSPEEARVPERERSCADRLWGWEGV